MLPDLVREFLPPGVHASAGEELIARFCAGADRVKFMDAVTNILDFAAARGALSVLFGGSFVSGQKSPRDLDCVVLFRSEEYIPAIRDALSIEGTELDVYFASEDQPEVKNSFLKLFAIGRGGFEVGVVSVPVGGDEDAWDLTWEPDEDTFDIVKRVYLNRAFVETIRRRKVLVTIHGLRSAAEWNADVTLVASANGWIVAPFRYGFINPDVFLRRQQRQAIVDQFRGFLADIHTLTQAQTVSVLAHSFGTYVAMNYVYGFDRPPTLFDTMIFAGAIVDKNLDLETLHGKVGHIINEVAPNDEWVNWARRANFGRDELFGDAGTQGFAGEPERLTQYVSPIFSHTNVIQRDVMVSRWMPALEANFGSAYRDSWEAAAERLKGDASLGA